MVDRLAARTRRVTLPFDADEFRRLQRIARGERRTVRDQVAHIVARWLDAIDEQDAGDCDGGTGRAGQGGDDGRPV